MTLSAPLSLNEIASVAGLSRSELYALNPGYRGEMVDPAKSNAYLDSGGFKSFN